MSGMKSCEPSRLSLITKLIVASKARADDQAASHCSQPVVITEALSEQLPPHHSQILIFTEKLNENVYLERNLVNLAHAHSVAHLASVCMGTRLVSEITIELYCFLALVLSDGD